MGRNMERFALKFVLWGLVGAVVLGGLYALENHGYDRAKLEQAKTELIALEKVEKLEKELSEKVGKVEIKYVERKQVIKETAQQTQMAVDDFSRAVDGVSDRASCSLPNNPQTAERIDDTATTDTLKQCAADLADLARVADELANQVTGLQDYVNSIAGD